MPEKWEGRTIDGFPLERLLGGGSDSPVFLTRYESRPAAIKLLPLDGLQADAQMQRWAAASRLSHPHLIRIFASGRGSIDDSDVIYVVMEYAEEDLSHVLPDRALTAAETRDMLEPALAALKYLHDQGFVHSHLKPSNIMAASDCLKLSSDGIRRAGESSEGSAGPYDPPERGPFSPACDVWALGVVLTEVLTQRRHGAPLESLPDPFATIAHHCLQQASSSRWTVSQISNYLAQQWDTAPKRRFTTPVGLWMILAIAAIVIAGTILLRREGPAPAKPAAQANVPEPPAAAQPEPEKPAPAHKSARKTVRPQPLAETPSETPATQPTDQPMPEILAEARSSIRGRVRVVVKLDVDPSGAVTNATLGSPASSKYFADRTLDAVRKWKFPAAGGAPQQWDVQFEFRPSGTKVTPRRLSP
ncbi:MAG TPA: TonB family protein [Bryobacteraceae bacterium]|nr:TonB family protein [Bryobacteraceae bacterium]